MVENAQQTNTIAIKNLFLVFAKVLSFPSVKFVLLLQLLIVVPPFVIASVVMFGECCPVFHLKGPKQARVMLN